MILVLLILFSINAFSQGSDLIKELEADSAKYYYAQIKSIAEKQKNKIIEAINLSQMGYHLYLSGDLPQGLQLTSTAL